MKTSWFHFKKISIVAQKLEKRKNELLCVLEFAIRDSNIWVVHNMHVTLQMKHQTLTEKQSGY